jgi:hypothetical protein
MQTCARGHAVCCTPPPPTHTHTSKRPSLRGPTAAFDEKEQQRQQATDPSIEKRENVAQIKKRGRETPNVMLLPHMALLLFCCSVPLGSFPPFLLSFFFSLLSLLMCV